MDMLPAGLCLVSGEALSGQHNPPHAPTNLHARSRSLGDSAKQARSSNNVVSWGGQPQVKRGGGGPAVMECPIQLP